MRKKEFETCKLNGTTMTAPTANINNNDSNGNKDDGNNNNDNCNCNNNNNNHGKLNLINSTTQTTCDENLFTTVSS